MTYAIQATKGAGPFPAALLITGSGAQDRNEALLGHRPFLVLSDYLTRHGIAVLRVDDEFHPMNQHEREFYHHPRPFGISRMGVRRDNRRAGPH